MAKQLLFKMARTAVLAISPSEKTIGGLLNEVNRKVEENLKRLLQGRMIGIIDDGQKGAQKRTYMEPVPIFA